MGITPQRPIMKISMCPLVGFVQAVEQTAEYPVFSDTMWVWPHFPFNGHPTRNVTILLFPFDDVIMLVVHWQLVSVFVNSTIITVWNKVLCITCNISQKVNIRLGADINSAVDNIHQIRNIKNNSEYDTCKKAVHWRNKIITQDHTTQNGSRHSCSSVRICPVL